MMKKLICFALSLFIMLILVGTSTFAASIPLNSVTVDVSKEKIAPGDEVTVNINFGTELGSYTFDVAYDSDIFDYVRCDGGTENDDKTRVRVIYYDSAGGTNPRTNMSVTFKAKADIESTNPTDFSITAEGLANKDASQEYDDITSPIKKSVTVEPNYVDYSIGFNYSGSIIPNVQKEMELITKSAMGRNYDHVKMSVEVTKKPTDTATVSMLATTRTRQEVDLIKDGWGEPDGYALGGKNVEQILDVRANFSDLGNYTIKVSLLDKDNSDAVIATKDFNFNVTETAVPDENEPEDNTQQKPGENTGGSETTKPEQKPEEELPQALPQTGTTQYVYIITALAVLSCAYIAVKNLRKEK